MRIQLNTAVLLLLASICSGVLAAPARAADGDQYLGVWSGTWAGADGSSGHFQLKLERGGDGKLTGAIAVSQDDGGGSDYTSKLKNAVFAGDKFTAAYEPPDGQSEIHMTGTFGCGVDSSRLPHFEQTSAERGLAWRRGQSFTS